LQNALSVINATNPTAWADIQAATADWLASTPPNPTTEAALLAAWAAISADIDAIDNNPALKAVLENAFPAGHSLRNAFDAARADQTDPDLLAALGQAVDAYLLANAPPTPSQYAALAAAVAAVGGPAWNQVLAVQAQYNYLDENLAAYEFNYLLHRWSIEHGMIPRVQQNLDGIVYAMVRMLNDALTGQLREANPDWNPAGPGNPDPSHPNYDILEGGRYRFVFPNTDPADPLYPFGHAQPWNLDGEQDGVPLFVRRYGMGAVDPANLNSIFTIENLMINPALLQPGGHNLIALSLGKDEVNDTRILEALQNVWRSNEGPYTVEIGGRNHRVQDAYIRMVNQISIDVNEALRYVDAQGIQVQRADNERQAVKGVSMDEELSAMLRFQYAFQAASRVINVLDTMIETIVRIGRG
jgi:hypothetical protein